MTEPFLSWLLDFGRLALGVLKNGRAEGAGYLAFAVIFVAAARFLPPQTLWLVYLFSLLALGAYVWRSDRAEQTRLRMAELQLAAQIAKLDAVKEKARAGKRKTLK